MEADNLNVSVSGDKSVGVFEDKMTKESVRTFVLTFDPEYKKLYELAKNQEILFWRAEELDYHADIEDWEEKLNDDERFFIKNILAFFACADGIVLQNLLDNFSSEIKINEARVFYAAQSYIETVHAQVYSSLVLNLIKDDDEKNQIFNAMETSPFIKLKSDWAKKWLDRNTANLAERLIAFAVVEGIFFSGSFCALYWLKSTNKMTQCLTKSNEFIARDENLHCEFAICLYNLLESKNKLSTKRIHEIIKEAVEVEIEFIICSLPCKLLGMNSDLMIKHIKYVADYWVGKIINSNGKPCEHIYNIDKTPFTFMERIALYSKENFFETATVSDYQKLLGSDKSIEKIIEEDSNCFDF